MFRGDERVRRPLGGIAGERDGVPYLCPEIVLLYKAGEPSPKNHADFRSAAPWLSTGATAWLADALRLTQPGTRGWHA